MVESVDSLSDSMICHSGSRLIASGLKISNSADAYILFVNAGGEAFNVADSSIKFLGDTFYEGGNIVRTNEHVIDAGDYPFIYQSARSGNFRYQFNNLPPGDYYIDLHCIEFIHTNGPKGLRVFNVFIQEEKVLMGFDIFATVGANKALQLVDLRVFVKEDGVCLIRFEGVIGSPAVSGIGIRRAPKVTGDIRVFCRCRPLNEQELATWCETVVDFDAAGDGCLGILTGSTRKSFRFDRVYTPKDDQVGVFVDASPMAISVLDGYIVCLFAYGKTGTGKAFTMEGTEQNSELKYRTLEQLFRIAQERSETFMFEISVSILEVYNEHIRDLLATSPASKKLEIEQAFEGSDHVPGIVEAKVENIEEVWTVLRTGSNARSIGSNNVNKHSSQPHCLLCIMVKTKNLMNGECTKSKLWLVELTGSERLAKTDVQGEQLKDGQDVNKFLLALADVLYALANKRSYIPYRSSKLTNLLQDSLGDDSKSLVVIQISPSNKDLVHTMSSLSFATQIRGIELGHAKKQADTSENTKLMGELCNENIDNFGHDISKMKRQKPKKIYNQVSWPSSKTRKSKKEPKPVASSASLEWTVTVESTEEAEKKGNTLIKIITAVWQPVRSTLSWTFIKWMAVAVMMVIILGVGVAYLFLPLHIKEDLSVKNREDVILCYKRFEVDRVYGPHMGQVYAAGIWDGKKIYWKTQHPRRFDSATFPVSTDLHGPNPYRFVPELPPMHTTKQPKKKKRAKQSKKEPVSDVKQSRKHAQEEEQEEEEKRLLEQSQEEEKEEEEEEDDDDEENDDEEEEEEDDDDEEEEEDYDADDEQEEEEEGEDEENEEDEVEAKDKKRQPLGLRDKKKQPLVFKDKKKRPLVSHLYLSITLSKKKCHTIDCKEEVPPHCTIHGLWPRWGKVSWQYKMVKPFDPKMMQEDKFQLQQMKTYWPSLGKGKTDMDFWAHEWMKHGGSFKGTQQQYFDRTMGLFRSINVEEVFRRAKINPGEHNTINAIARLRQEFKLKSVLVCEFNPVTDRIELVGIIFCATPDGKELEDCPVQDKESRGCTDKFWF